jgi:REP element-mobilizing transposase RayT
MSAVINMEKPSRKQNRLPDYDCSQSGAYFVTLCTHNRARLFEMETPVGNDLCVVPDNGTAHRPCPTKGNLIIHKWIRETENKFPDITIDKYAVMPDHLHLIVTIKEQYAGCSLPDVMRFSKP